MLSKLEAALLTTNIDAITALVIFGADQAFIWTGQSPKSIEEFYVNLGNSIRQGIHEAVDKAVPSAKEDFEWGD